MKLESGMKINGLPWTVYLFMGFEVLLLILTMILVLLIIKYIRSIPKKDRDPYIVWSFVMVALAVSDRLIVNFMNYGFAFAYSGYTEEISTAQQGV